MKKLLLVTLATFLYCAPSFAQTYTTLTPKAEAKCTELTRQMALKLHLNEAEYIKLKALNRERIANTEEVMQTISDDMMLQQQLKNIELEYDKKVIALLKPKQIEVYASLKQEMPKAKFVAAGEE